MQDNKILGDSNPVCPSSFPIFTPRSRCLHPSDLSARMRKQTGTLGHLMKTKLIRLGHQLGHGVGHGIITGTPSGSATRERFSAPP